MSERSTHSHSHSTGSSRKNRQEPQPRIDLTPEDDRPFSEIRKTLLDVLRIGTVHRWAFFVPFCLATSAAFLLSLYYPRTYSASTTFERRSDPVILNLPLSPGAASFNYFRSTIERDLTSVANIADAVERMEVGKSLERDADGKLTSAGLKQRNQIAGGLASTLRASRSSPSDQIDIVTLTYTGEDPRIGRTLVEQVKRSYTARTMVWLREFLEDQRDYLLQQASEALEEFQTAQREETALRLQHPHVDPTDPGGLVIRLSQLEIEKRELQSRKRDQETELTALRQMLATLEATDPQSTEELAKELARADMTHPQASRLLAQIESIDKEIARLRTSRGMTDEHPEIRQLFEDRRRVEHELTSATEPGSAPASDAPEQPGPRAVAAAHPAAWHAERTRLQLQIKAAESKLNDLAFNIQANEASIGELREARQDVFDDQEVFATAIGKVSRARTRHSQLDSAVAALEPAITAAGQGRLIHFSDTAAAKGGAVPVRPTTNSIIFLALAAGAVIGAIFVILAEVFDHVYRSSGQVARSLGVPILEAIDEIITASDRRKRLVRRLVLAPLAASVFAGVTLGAGALAYLSLQQPWTYERIRGWPSAAIDAITPGGRKSTSQAAAPSGSQPDAAAVAGQ